MILQYLFLQYYFGVVSEWSETRRQEGLAPGSRPGGGAVVVWPMYYLILQAGYITILKCRD